MKIYSYVSMLNESGNPYLEKSTSYKVDGRRTYTHQDDVAEFIYNSLHLQDYAEEYMWVMCFDNIGHLIGCFELSHGNVDSSIATPREIFQKSLMIGAVKIVLAHNHPGNDPSPSGEDIKATRRIVEAGQIIGIKVLDHFVVAKSGYVSMKERSMM